MEPPTGLKWTSGLVLAQGFLCMEHQAEAQPPQSPMLAQLHDGVLEHLVLPPRSFERGVVGFSIYI